MNPAWIVWLAGWLVGIAAVYHGTGRTWADPHTAAEIAHLRRIVDTPAEPLAVAMTSLLLWWYLIVDVPRTIWVDRRYAAAVAYIATCRCDEDA